MINETLLSPLNSSEDLNISSSGELSEEDLIYWDSVLSDSRYTAQRILVPIVLIIGAIGNSITIAVLTRRHMQTSTNLYLSALAISDIMYLVFMFSLSLRHTPGMSHRNHWFYWHYYRYALWLTDASSSTSIWLTVTFTIERYIAVCHPIKGKVFCTQSRAKRVIMAVYVLCFLLTITTPHEWVVVPDDRRNGTHLTLADSELGMNQTYRKTFYWFSAVTFILLPLSLLAAFNTFLILAVKRSRKQRNVIAYSQRDSTSTQENKITVMLIAVVLLALVCQLPTAAMLIYTSFHKLGEGTVELYVCTILNNFFNLLTAVNAAANFVFYCALSDRYRRTFLQTFCRKWYQSHSPPPSWIATTGYTNFEDGSPRTSMRGSMRCSSLRTSRRSSYRSSPSSTSSPRASPSHTYGRGIDRHSHGGSFLRVPQRDLAKHALQEEEVDDVPQPTSQSFLLKHSLHNGEAGEHNNKFSFDEKDLQRRSSSELLTETIKITADSEIVPHTITEVPERKTGLTHSLVKWFSSLRFRKVPTSSVTHDTRSQSILIRCQPPSTEDQTAV